MRSYAHRVRAVLAVMMALLCAGVAGGGSTAPSYGDADIPRLIREAYFSKEYNYAHTNAFCYIRAFDLPRRLPELNGPDGRWGTADDRYFRIFMRYPRQLRKGVRYPNGQAREWLYHSAGVLKDAHGNLVVCDGINSAPRRFRGLTVREWVCDWAYSNEVVFCEPKDISRDPPDGKVLVAICPGDQLDVSGRKLDPYSPAGKAALGWFLDELQQYNEGIRKTGFSPTPYPETRPPLPDVEAAKTEVCQCPKVQRLFRPMQGLSCANYVGKWPVFCRD